MWMEEGEFTLYWESKVRGGVFWGDLLWGGFGWGRGCVLEGAVFEMG